MLNGNIFSFDAFREALLSPFGRAIFIFLLGAIVSYAYEVYRLKRSLSPKNLFSYVFPASGWKSKSTAMDVVMFAGNKVLGVLIKIKFVVLSIVIAEAVSGGLHWLMPGHQAAHAGMIAAAFCAFALFLFADFAAFLQHYIQHKVPFLWELHKVHHSALFLSPLTTARMHPLAKYFEAIIEMSIIGIPLGIATFYYDLSIEKLLLLWASTGLITLTFSLDALKHSHIPVSFGPLDYVVMSPHMHQLHHSAKFEHWDKNMGGILSIWDYWFGTLHLPEKGEVLSYGVGRGPAVDREFETPYGIYIRPIVQMTRVVLGRVSPSEVPPPADSAPVHNSSVQSSTEQRMEAGE
jgi:sterol desaturase/sphingolipid hydroxylase (fatty acid hydroxylase superfamily)